MLGGVGLISISHEPWFLFTMYFLLGPVHFAMTIALLKSANFEVLNQTNLTLISRAFVKGEDVPTLKQVNGKLSLCVILKSTLNYVARFGVANHP